MRCGHNSMRRKLGFLRLID